MNANSASRVFLTASLLLVVSFSTIRDATGGAMMVVPGVRNALPGEGLLEFKPNPDAGDYGEEWTGWVDIRHPALGGGTNVMNPYDRSDRVVDVKTITVTDNAGTTAMPSINRDFHYANKIWMQMGVTVLEEETDTLTHNGAQAPAQTFPFNTGAEDDAMKIFERSANPSAVNLYYIQSYTNANLLGLASPPVNFGGNVPRNDGIGMVDAALDNTMAHELGHMVLNGDNSIHMGAPNIMAPVNNNRTFSQIGPVGGQDTFTNAQVGAAFTAPAMGMPNSNNAGLVQRNSADHRYGNRVDWDFVVDHISIEGVLNADNYPGFGDSLYFEPGFAQTGFDSQDHNHEGLGVFMQPGDYMMETFRTADVFSLGLLYSDYDHNAAGVESLMEAALDYEVTFRAGDGSLAQGQIMQIFEEGWSATTNADNFLARWWSPIDAVGVFITAKTGGGYDGIAQIDAIIVSNIPEPATLAFLATATACLIGARRC